MNNKITFCSYPDTITHANLYAIKNYNNETIKFLLNNIEQDASFYLLDDKNPNEWLIKAIKQSKIIIDCATISLHEIKNICQKK
jgi:hypothetical protein